MERVRNGDLDQWEVAFPVEPKATLGVVNMVPGPLNGWYIRPSESQVRFWAIAHSAQMGT